MKTLDVKNYGCPVPAVWLRREFKRMQTGDQLQVFCNSKDALNDLLSVMKDTKNTLLSNTMDSTGKVPVWTLVVEKAA